MPTARNAITASRMPRSSLQATAFSKSTQGNSCVGMFAERSHDGNLLANWLGGFIQLCPKLCCVFHAFSDEVQGLAGKRV
jgi:hypothetical protein